jgi:hypothetical protein
VTLKDTARAGVDSVDVELRPLQFMFVDMPDVFAEQFALPVVSEVEYPGTT